MLKLLTALIFIASYALIVKYYDRKNWIVAAGAVALLLVGAITPSGAWHAINWNVIGIYVGMLFIAEALIESKLLDAIASWLVNHSKRASTAMLLVCVTAGILSIVIENVAAVLVVAPMAFIIARKLKVNPVPMVIGCAVCSNLEGVATMIGDPPSLLLAGHAGLRFMDFIFYHGRPGLFFAVQLGLIAGLFVLYPFFRKYDHPSHHIARAKVKSVIPGLALLCMILGLALIPDDVLSTGIICVLFGLVALAWLLYEHKRNERSLIKEVYGMDWQTAVFLILVFVVVHALTATGLVSDIAATIQHATGSSVFWAFVLVVGISLCLSAFIDNVPYTAAMLGVIQLVADRISAEPMVLYFGLLIGASVGGNITPVGASANIVGMGLLRNKGYKVSFWEFVKIGLPFTLVSATVSAVFIWLMFG